MNLRTASKASGSNSSNFCIASIMFGRAEQLFKQNWVFLYCLHLIIVSRMKWKSLKRTTKRTDCVRVSNDDERRCVSPSFGVPGSILSFMTSLSLLSLWGLFGSFVSPLPLLLPLLLSFEVFVFYQIQTKTISNKTNRYDRVLQRNTQTDFWNVSVALISKWQFDFWSGWLISIKSSWDTKAHNMNSLSETKRICSIQY